MNEHILVVDDEQPICDLLHMVLTHHGYRVTAVTDYPSAVDAIDRDDFDVILSDIVLEGPSGIDLLMAVRERNLRTPVVLVTGYPTIDSAAQSVRHGAFDYLTKPVRNKELLRIVELAIRHKAVLDREQKLERELLRQKRLYQSIVEDQTELICRFTPDGMIRFVNDAYVGFFGGVKADLVGSDAMAVVCEADREGFKDRLRAIGRDRPLVHGEHRVSLADGRIRWLSRTDRGIFDDDGGLLEIQSVSRDITDRKTAEASLEKSQMELEAVFQSIPEGIITVDGTLTVIRKNRPLDGICPVGRDIVPGTALETCLAGHGGCSGECLNILRHTLKTRQAVKEYQLDCGAGTAPRRLILTCAPMQDRERRFRNAILVVRDITRLADLEERLRERESFGDIIGGSEAMRHVYTLIRQLADLDNTVLVTGESGTGKELVMEALHRGGGRAKGPLVRVNCAALPEHLLQSELFGHVRGAFTGAVRDRVGRFQAAEGGTLFLDEIGDLPLHLQLRLLRAVERKEFERVGDDETHRADVRIVAATHVNLEERVRRGTFREDLYYRLNVMNIHLPPLRERKGDIPLLVSHFCDHFGALFNKRFTGADAAVMDLFLRYPWPGNIRELKHVVEHACILCPGGRIDRRFLADRFLSPGGRSDGDPGGPEEPEVTAQEIRRWLDRTDGNKAKAARMMGISRSTLYRRMRNYGLT